MSDEWFTLICPYCRERSRDRREAKRHQHMCRQQLVYQAPERSVIPPTPTEEDHDAARDDLLGLLGELA